MKNSLTVLTDPLPYGRYFIIVILKLIYYKIKFLLKKNDTQFNYYGGHFAVTRSVIEGFIKLGVKFNYNPKKIEDIAEVVHVLSGVRTLRQMINFKRRGYIKKLYAGPNIVTISTEANSILTSPEIDGVINHCEFACAIWAFDHPELYHRCFIWPAGVDVDFWKPDDYKRGNSILIFDKRIVSQDPRRTEPYINYLMNLGWHVNIIRRYSNNGYTKNEYLELLQNSCLMVGFTVGSESQGIAWAEAWACNVPTLILKNSNNCFNGRQFPCSTAPYLGSKTGLFFDDIDDFKIQFNQFISNPSQFSPRDWVLSNMSDVVSAKLLYNHLME